jgi:UDP-glucose-4-epimerase GalE
MRVLITGGAGYIGSHLALSLAKAQHDIICVDNLRRPLNPALSGATVTRQVDIRDTAALCELMREQKTECVIHLAAVTFPGESVREPIECYSINVGGTVSVLQAMLQAGVDRLVFASSCAVYGSCKPGPVGESAQIAPTSPYGQSKQVAEQVIRDVLAANGNVGAFNLRFFNVSGGLSGPANGGPLTAAARLIPVAIRSTRETNTVVTINGVDWPTPDGTCIRDFVHIDDICRGIEVAMHRVRPGCLETVNLGSGTGHSVLQVIREVEESRGHPVKKASGPRLSGDPAAVTADITRAKELLDWIPQASSLRKIVESVRFEQDIETTC